MRWMILCGVLWIAGCSPLIPPTVPPQLSHTPGVFITIDDHFVGTEEWHIRYPDGWRVVKISIAADPIRLVFVAPDETMLIEVSEVPPSPSTPAPQQIIVSDVLSVGNRMLYLSGSGQQASQREFEQIYEWVRASLRVQDQQ